MAKCRISLDQARLLTLQAAHCIDTLGTKASRSQVAAIKVVAIQAAQEVVDQAIQLHGGAGVSQDTFLPYAYVTLRTLRIADGPDEVHLHSIAKSILNAYHPPSL